MSVDTRQAVKDQYAVAGENYDEIRSKDPRGKLLSDFDINLMKAMVRDIPRDSKVLEVGAGTGRFTVPMIQAGFHVTATDYNDTLLATLREYLKSENLSDQTTVQQEDVFALSFPDETFDFVYCLHVIPRLLCLKDQQDALQQLSRVLKPGGKLLYNFWNRSSLLGLMTKKYAARSAEMDAALRDLNMKVIDRRGKWVLSRRVLQRLPLAGGRLLTACEKSFSQVLPRQAWDVFILAEKER
jgi:ubiquinone/menaquinone biosynthesis C-methylase UbiE